MAVAGALAVIEAGTREANERLAKQEKVESNTELALNNAQRTAQKLDKVKEAMMKAKETEPEPWKCKLCIKSQDECGEYCKGTTWEAVSADIAERRKSGEGCLQGSITAVPPLGCSPTVALSTKLDPAPAGKKVKYCLAAFRSESARRYGQPTPDVLMNAFVVLCVLHIQGFFGVRIGSEWSLHAPHPL